MDVSRDRYFIAGQFGCAEKDCTEKGEAKLNSGREVLARVSLGEPFKIFTTVYSSNLI